MTRDSTGNHANRTNDSLFSLEEGVSGISEHYDPKKLDVEIETIGDVAIVTLKEDSLSVSNSKVFKAKLEPLLTSHTQIVIDLSNVRFLDSSGIGVIVSTMKALKAGNGSLKLCGVTNHVMSLFQLVRLDRLLEIHQNKEEALKSFSATSN